MKLNSPTSTLISLSCYLSSKIVCALYSIPRKDKEQLRRDLLRHQAEDEGAREEPRGGGGYLQGLVGRSRGGGRGRGARKEDRMGGDLLESRPGLCFLFFFFFFFFFFKVAQFLGFNS